ncbi:hypothetical protein SD457_26315 [Coprobacillaceae bacterium CR2/5/TPMF4]|nr:hypothetical protein SD457_26315 [Coprobacillaceae bacterium CR2/5/TPMF4]
MYSVTNDKGNTLQRTRKVTVLQSKSQVIKVDNKCDNYNIDYNIYHY